MTWTYRIEVRFRTEGECIYRKREADIPRIPGWSVYFEGGRTFTKSKNYSPAQLSCKKRTFRPNLYYKAYHVEYYAWHKTTSYGLVTAPSDGYLRWVTQIVNPLPKERFIESRSTRASIEPFIFHYADYYYQFEDVDGTLQAILEKKEEGYFRRERLGNGHWRDVPVDDEVIREIEKRENAMKGLFPVVSRAIHRNIMCLEELMKVIPEDVENQIGLGPMSMLEPSAREIGWGTNEYWDGLMKRARQNDRNFCIGLALMGFEEDYEKYITIENKYKESSEQFENKTIIRGGKPFVEIDNDFALDLEEVCEVIGKVIYFLKTDNKDDSTSYDVLDKFADYYLDIIQLSFDEIYILPTLKIAVQKKLNDNND